MGKKSVFRIHEEVTGPIASTPPYPTAEKKKRKKKKTKKNQRVASFEVFVNCVKEENKRKY